jgi:uncharacterized protein YfaT (DUF1175 family)
MTRGSRRGVLIPILLALAVPLAGQVRLADDTDRAAFASWFVFLADAEFYRPTPDVTDCAGLVRHAFREALRAHTPEWIRQANLPLAPGYPDVRRAPHPGPDGWPLFRVPGDRYAEFADAVTIVRLNARPVGRDVAAARPGDLLFFHDPDRRMADHLMVVVGRSRFQGTGTDWVVYHTGPDGLGNDPRNRAPHPAGPRAVRPAAPGQDGKGEVRKARLADLLRHPSPRWRPLESNPRFAGVFRLAILW